MNFNDINSTYSREATTVLFNSAHNDTLLNLSNLVYQFNSETSSIEDYDPRIEEFKNICKLLFNKLISNLTPYIDTLTDLDFQELDRCQYILQQTHPYIFEYYAQPIVKYFKKLGSENINPIVSTIKEIFNKIPANHTLAIVTRRRQHNIEFIIGFKNRDIQYFNYSEFKKNSKNFEHVFYIGNPNYFGPYAKSTFKSDFIHFISYDVYANQLVPFNVLEPIKKSEIYSTIYNNVIIKNGLQRSTEYELDQESDEQLLLQKSIASVLSADINSERQKVDAIVVTFDNNKFAFLSPDSNIRTYLIDEKKRLDKKSISDLITEDFIILRSESESELVSNIADKHILKNRAKYYRYAQKKWKRDLYSYVSANGIQQTSTLLMDTKKISTASIQNIESWIFGEVIRPNHLKEILETIGYATAQANLVDEQMYIIKNAHIAAGKMITDNLIKSLNLVNNEILTKTGSFNLETPEFPGANFNILRISSIENSSVYRVSYSNLNKLYAFR